MRPSVLYSITNTNTNLKTIKVNGAFKKKERGEKKDGATFTKKLVLILFAFLVVLIFLTNNENKKLSVLGSSGSGKSILITEILNNFTKCTNSQVEPTFVYCYKTQLPEGLIRTANSYCYQGIPNLKNLRLEFAKDNKPLVLVLDDLLSGKNKKCNIFHFFSSRLKKKKYNFLT